jgi:hypothetical protein
MKILFHIGMGKTGTSSIQRALQDNEKTLAAQKVEYLGMWFTPVDPSFMGHEGQKKFFQSSDEAIQGYGLRLAEVLKARADKNGTELFLYSNEGLFGLTKKFAIVLTELRAQGVKVELLAYMRDPHTWLPSAFTQWGIRHKNAPGPIQTFGERARNLIHQYDPIRFWHQNFSDLLTLRRHEKDIDVVQDFSQAIGIKLEEGEWRQLERGENTEILLRGMFNNHSKGEARPDRFERIVLNVSRRAVASVPEMVERCFSMEGIDDIVAENAEIFTFIRNTYGFDYLQGVAKEPRPVDMAELQGRLVDYLIEISFQQSERITRLERQLQKLSTEE